MKLDHIGIAVKNLEESLSRWSEFFNGEVRGIEEIKERGVRLAHLALKQGPSIEIVSPWGEGSTLEKFLIERGEGIHHFCFEIDDTVGPFSRVIGAGIGLVGADGRPAQATDKVGYTDPRKTHGAVHELVPRGFFKGLARTITP